MGITIQDAADFAQRMAALGPFEKSPHMAVAVSGGADSMALALLADRWARDLGGRVSALTVITVCGRIPTPKPCGSGAG